MTASDESRPAWTEPLPQTPSTGGKDYDLRGQEQPIGAEGGRNRPC